VAGLGPRTTAEIEELFAFYNATKVREAKHGTLWDGLPSGKPTIVPRDKSGRPIARGLVRAILTQAGIEHEFAKRFWSSPKERRAAIEALKLPQIEVSPLRVKRPNTD